MPLDVLHWAGKKGVKEIAQVLMHLDELLSVEGRAFRRNLRPISLHAAYRRGLLGLSLQGVTSRYIIKGRYTQDSH